MNEKTDENARAPRMRGRAGRMGWRVLGSVFAVTLIACGALTAVGALTQQSAIDSQTYHQEVSRVVVNLDIGHLTINRGDQDTITVEREVVWSGIRPESEETWDGTTLRIQPDCGILILGDSCRVNYTLLVPSEVTVEASTSTGDIAVNDVAGDLWLSVDNGNIALSNVSGSIVVSTSSGRIDATGLTSAEAQANVDTGDVDLLWAAQPTHIAVNITFGDVDITVPEGDPYLVQANASSGSATVNVLQDVTSARIITATSADGDVLVRHP